MLISDSYKKNSFIKERKKKTYPRHHKSDEFVLINFIYLFTYLFMIVYQG